MPSPNALVPCPSQHQNSPTHVLPFFSDSTDLSLKCEDSKALSLQTCDFFQKISRSNLCLTDPWQLQISLFLSLLALHLVEKLSDSHLYQAAQVFIMCIHRICHILYTSKTCMLHFFDKHPRNSDKNVHVAAILLFFFLSFLLHTHTKIVFLAKLKQIKCRHRNITVGYKYSYQRHGVRKPSVNREIRFPHTNDEPGLCPLKTHQVKFEFPLVFAAFFSLSHSHNHEILRM